MSQPVLLFDVIETLFSLQPLRDRMAEEGLGEPYADLFFAQLLRDAFALSATGVFHPFPAIAAGTLKVVLSSAGKAADAPQVKRLLSSFSELPAHPDVAPALAQARSAGVKIILLTNGSADNTRQLVAREGLSALVDGIVSIDEHSVWKPQPTLYQAVCKQFNTPQAETTVIAAHAWDVHGARQAGLRAVWVERQDHYFHELMSAPSGEARTLPEAVSMALIRSGRH
ncbi:2-haloacid dehalogenase [Marinimicrobium koreense]|uniref:(S)-2-haloacid dehalogenase n=1 Tax=Marinimicrobium koreense TaxID=306545 RepID=A0A3N1P3W6_9GAMM|nr:haloacid dehalogenase type II [Marinimicrobium koreense]ROQ21410.1 2-haloacid dehalogenase [Marinimicrobium koreense]